MDNHQDPNEQRLGGSSIAGPLRWVLLALGALGLVAGGTVGGVALERLRITPGPVEQAHAADSKESHKSLDPPTETVHHDPTNSPEIEIASTHDEELVADEPTPEAASASSPTSEKRTVQNSESAPTADPFSSVVDQADRVSKAEQYILEGQYKLALRLLRDQLREGGGLLEAPLRLRSALCHEALGDFPGAQSDYARVVELNFNSELNEAAILGQARVWSKSGRRELATAILFQTMLEQGFGDARRMPSPLPHQLAILLSQRVRDPGDAQNSDDPLDVNILTVPKLSIRPDHLLMELMQAPAPLLERRALASDQVAVENRFGKESEEINMIVRMRRAPALEVVKQTINSAGRTVELTQAARLRLQEHTVHPDCSALPLAIILDAILDPFDLVWREQGDSILISVASQATADELASYRVQSAKRMLRHAATHAPSHDWALVTAMEQARVESISGALESAAHAIERAIRQFGKSEYSGVAYLNQGKLYLRLGSPELALRSFQHACDQLTGHPLEMVAYLYAGRVHLECDAPRDAVAPLLRSVALSRGHQREGVVILQLSSAYLMLQNYPRANQLLVDHQRSLQQGTMQDQGAFLASYIRYQAAPDDHQRMREAATLMSALTNLDVGQTFGGHWWLLVGTAYRHIGMTSEEVAVFQRCLTSAYPFKLQDRIRIQLLDSVPQPLQTVPHESASAASPFRAQAILSEAEVAMRRGDDQAALDECMRLLTRSSPTDEVRRSALRLMGRIYQARGDHERAVACFTGSIPLSTKQSDRAGAPQGDVR